MRTKSTSFKSCIVLLISFFIFTALESCKDTITEPEISERQVIITMMNSTQEEIQAPGWILGVKRPANPYEISGGYANLADGVEMTITDLIRIGSITKTYTATLVLVLCDEEILRLNEKLSDYYPDFPRGDEVTIRQLLMHTSGIVSWDENEDIRMQIYNGTGDWTIDKLIDWAAQQEFHFEPGTGYHYSNIGYFLLGKIIEQSTSMTVAEALQEKICLPLELNNTFMAESPHPGNETVHGYDESSGTVLDITGTPQADAINYELAWTAGGMFSTMDDLSTWIRAMVNGSLLSDSLHSQQMPVLSPPSDTLPFWSGYGMGISQTDVWLGHTGAVCGYVCNVSYYPAEDASIVYFFNKFSAFDLDANIADLGAVSENFLDLATHLYPETLQPGN